MNKQTLFIFKILVLSLSVSGCLKTRSEVNEAQQSQIYQRKQIENQTQHQAQGQNHISNQTADDRDEVIRSLNGRIENLEAELSKLKTEKNDPAKEAESQKIQSLQDALVKMESQIQKLEAEKQVVVSASRVDTKPETKADSKNEIKNDTKIEVSSTKNKNAYEVAQDLFEQKEWKKSILAYQKYIEEAPKGKYVPEAKYRMGVSFQELGLKDEAIAFYEEVIAQYSKTESAKKSKLRLAKIKKK